MLPNKLSPQKRPPRLLLGVAVDVVVPVGAGSENGDVVDDAFLMAAAAALRA